MGKEVHLLQTETKIRILSSIRYPSAYSLERNDKKGCQSILENTS